VAIVGNVVRYGTNGVEGVNESNVVIVGNVFASITTIDSLEHREQGAVTGNEGP
jgi:hypothetical protein